MTAGAALQREIEAIFREMTGRACIFVPSARLGIYLALRTLFRPGDRLLVSPLTDDIVLFTVLAAGIRPVAAPVSMVDGNIDPDAVSPSTWASLRGVLTTNLYGLPDRVAELRRCCDAHGLILVEDVAHALHSRVDGVPLGSFGDVGVFSLSKHAHGVGGVVAVTHDDLAGELARLLTRVRAPRSLAWRTRNTVQPVLSAALARIHLRTLARRTLRAAGLGGRKGHRMPLRPRSLRRELFRNGTNGRITDANEMRRWDPWIGFDLRGYRAEPEADALERTVAWLRQCARDQEARLEAVEHLRWLPAAAPAVRAGAASALFRVPLLVTDREAAGRALAAAGHAFEYVYDPPLDDYAGPEFVEPSTAPEAARWWARHAVPIDPLLAPGLDAVLAGPLFEPVGCGTARTGRPATARAPAG
jgi:hypothetical protein